MVHRESDKRLTFAGSLWARWGLSVWFDGHAGHFDEGAGLAPDVGRCVAGAIVERSGATPEDVILDVGAGTGAVGRHFASLLNGYLGLDVSRPMLDAFRRGLGVRPPHMLLVQADGDRPWPVRDRALAAVFASRVVHHLRAPHFVAEAQRVCRPGGYLLLGRVTRDAGSLPSRLRRHKETLLGEHGLRPRAGARAVEEVLDACRARGATALPPTAVARWTRRASPRRLIAAWGSKPQLSSHADTGLNEQGRFAILNRLTEQAREEFGDLDREEQFVEEYTLHGARLP